MISNENNIDISKLFDVLCYSAEKHKGQFRKGADKAPYINHPMQVANLIVKHYIGYSWDLIAAAILHDVVEDTDVKEKEIENLFGKKVSSIVMEVTDDKKLPKAARKQMQITSAKKKSLDAKILKISDKITNIKEVIENPPINWDWNRKMEYLKWSEDVVNQMRGVCAPLEDIFDFYLIKGIEILNQEKQKKTKKN